jgi:hypothetical protein
VRVTVYVDPLMDHGWILRGRQVSSCHLFSDQIDATELHKVAAMIGCRRSWFQNDGRVPHYDLTIERRQAAIGCGAIAVERREAVAIWQTRVATRNVFLDLWSDRHAIDTVPAMRRVLGWQDGTIDQLGGVALCLLAERK